MDTLFEMESSRRLMNNNNPLQAEQPAWRSGQITDSQSGEITVGTVSSSVSNASRLTH